MAFFKAMLQRSATGVLVLNQIKVVLLGKGFQIDANIKSIHTSFIFPEKYKLSLKKKALHSIARYLA